MTKSIEAGAALSCISCNADKTRVVVGSREVLKIFSVDDEGFKEGINLRSGSKANLSNRSEN